MGEMLHYHVVVDDNPAACWTATHGAAARRIQRQLKHEGRASHVYRCVPSDPECPSVRPAEQRPSPVRDEERP